ncbi:MAG: TIR domain-containing protein [Candidatus Dadabacteria bacterium]|nr:TIR domain-containing protein [Candidatus Dadabacteria bacterium]
MQHDVFISFSDSDSEIAEALAEALKIEGLSATLGPAGVRGKAGERAVDEEIDASGALLLVFSWNARGSRRLLREVERAVDEGTPVVSFHADKTPFDPELEYYIAPSHRISAQGASAVHAAERLVETVKRLVPRGETAAGRGSTAVDAGVFGRPDTGELHEFKKRLRREGGEAHPDVKRPAYAPPRKRPWTKIAISALAVLFILYALGEQFGYYSVGVMAGCVLAAGLLIGLARSRRRSPMFPALALTGGHLLWFAAGLVVLVLGTAGGEPAGLDGIMLDAGIFAVFFLGLLLWPGVVSGAANVALSVLFIYLGLKSIAGDWTPPEVASAVTLHALLYAGTIIALVYGMVKVWWARH